MKYSIELSNRARKFLPTLSEKNFKLVTQKIDSLQADP